MNAARSRGREVAILESKLTAIGFGFLIPFFFVTSGLTFDLDALVSGALLELLGNPPRHFRVVHVAGSKGKGSTSAMLAAVLRRAGNRTGEARLLAAQGQIYCEMDRYDDAAAYFEQALTLYAEVGAVTGLAVVSDVVAAVE